MRIVARPRGLLCSPGGQELALEHFQSVGEVAALERDRLVVGAVDEHPLVGIQTDADAGRRVATVVGAIPHHDVEAAIAAVRLVESDEALVADRGEDGLVRTDRPQILDGFLGMYRKTAPTENDEAAHRSPNR